MAPPDPPALDDADPSWRPFLTELARAADLCLKPWRHGLRFSGSAPSVIGDCSDCCLLIEARDGDGQRCPERDLELEIYRSGSDLNLMLSHCSDAHAPVLWHGQHAVWMRAADGERCERPAEGAPLEAFCRRVRALVSVEAGA